MNGALAGWSTGALGASGVIAVGGGLLALTAVAALLAGRWSRQTDWCRQIGAELRRQSLRGQMAERSKSSIPAQAQPDPTPPEAPNNVDVHEDVTRVGAPDATNAPDVHEDVTQVGAPGSINTAANTEATPEENPDTAGPEGEADVVTAVASESAEAAFEESPDAPGASDEAVQMDASEPASAADERADFIPVEVEEPAEAEAAPIAEAEPAEAEAEEQENAAVADDGHADDQGGNPDLVVSGETMMGGFATEQVEASPPGTPAPDVYVDGTNTADTQPSSPLMPDMHVDGTGTGDGSTTTPEPEALPDDSQGEDRLLPETPVPDARLEGVDPARLAARLVGEHPQTVAVVLAVMPEAAATVLVQHLPDDLRDAALGRLADLEVVAADVVQTVVTTLSHPAPTAPGALALDGRGRAQQLRGALTQP